MQAELITIGDEILIGQIVDTNSAWMAVQLGLLGIRVHQITSISDRQPAILMALTEAESRSDLILVTGGLGPTRDDVTKQTLALYFQSGWRIDPGALENVQAIFKRYAMPLLAVNLDQARVPDCCEVIQNTKGTAPGMWFERSEKIMAFMPGVPHEMMAMMTLDILPRLKKRAGGAAFIHQTLLTAGLGESFLAEKIEPLLVGLPEHITLAYLPKPGQVRLRLTGAGPDPMQIQQEIDFWTRQIVASIPEYMVMIGDGTLAQALLSMLETKKKTLSVAESCTGGMISSQLTAVVGASKVYLGGVVAYSNALKIKFLGVNKQTLDQFGAVSEETVREMVAGSLQSMNSDFALATSGIAGPDGGSADKPVGTVWIGWGSRDHIQTQKYQLGTDRMIIIERAATAGLLGLIKHLDQYS